MRGFMFTVIVPFKNAASWIRRCAESLRQLDGDIDFIFVDDGSTDGGDDIMYALEREDDRFSVHFNTHEPGVSGTRNTALDVIKDNLGIKPDWISFLDADDEYAPGALNAMIASTRMYPDAQLIQLNHVRAVNNGTIPRMQNPRGKYDLYNLPKLWMSSCNKLFRADLIEDIRFDEKLRHGEDELFVLECLRRTRCIYNSEHIALYYHKDNPNSLSTTTSFDDLLGEQRALLDFLDKYRDDGEITFAIRQRMTELWNNAVYKRTFGG